MLMSRSWCRLVRVSAVGAAAAAVAAWVGLQRQHRVCIMRVDMVHKHPIMPVVCQQQSARQLFSNRG